MIEPPPPPAHLGEPERAIWRHVFEDFSGTSRLAFERNGATVDGRDGQLRAHPLLAVERDSRAAWLQAVKLLGLEL